MGESAWHSYNADSEEHISGRGDVYRIETLQSCVTR